ncbi:MAG: flagellar M-ring protein FliF [Alphaproteobacteria bacterium]|nr:flagellar M-ring protein FliF [Alphaproteobacteria bacterium]
MDSFLETLKQLGPSRLGVMGGILVGLIIFFVFISLRISAPEMKVLYTNLSTNDASAIAAKLEENEIKYQISPDGSRIVASEDEIGRARMLLAEAGLPNGGSLGYEIFDKQSGFGTTNFVQNINQVRALEGELSRTITSLENIRSTRVHLVLPHRELFSRESRQSSASVFLGIYSGASISREQIVSIQSLVSSAVPDLKASNVSIIDSNGNLLARGGEEEVNLLTLKAEEMRRGYEARLVEKIESQVSRIVGYGKVRAVVTAEINFDRISTNEEIFDPETQVVRSSQITEESNLEREPTPKDISIANNLPGVGGDLLVDNSPSTESKRLEEVTNFEIGKTIRNTIREVGEIKKLSVAILVDGRYVTDDKDTPDDTEDDEKIYEPRTQEELDQITILVRSAIGFDDDRGDSIEVINLQFAKIDTDEEILDQSMLFGIEKSQLLDLAELILIITMITLIVVLVLQPMVNKLLTSETSDDDAFEANLISSSSAKPALAAPEIKLDTEEENQVEESLINIQGVEGKVKASSIKKVEEIIETYPTETVSVIRSWMTEDS